MTETRTGLLLLNLGTPEHPTAEAVRPYLREFLMDPYVIDINGVLRWLLVNGIIVPFRSPRSAHAYQAIWTEEGSPLLVNTRNLARAVAERLSGRMEVRFAMRYGSPSILDTLADWKDLDRLYVLPLYPQYALSSTQSSLDRVREVLRSLKRHFPVHFLKDFHDRPEFTGAVAQTIERASAEFAADHLLLSYHGLPVRHVQKTAPSSQSCGRDPSCCETLRADNRNCYRAQSYATSRELARLLRLDPSRYTVCFQSRLGRAEWIKPYTDEILKSLASRGVRRLLVACPSFVADCLETLEEIAQRGRDDFKAAGGEDLRLIPCLNADPRWVEGLAEMVSSRPELWSTLEY